ncbi:aminotransferase class I/II-fold pyridoxal phosphate-dependent enzyme [Miniphocaeibacter halophilus]|uniref:Aminotransferase class I/II-fold pyridoxal phosphate-dependent enzyme n=1 Tax=Miniphocaeibacter halophilus TaxID=2931922 RepID=A0AC61MNJ1_9FIRM|nr:aminotransferase class I/II-fold pyridoxal phosphate-dependent enzyme [Miniphocaeibacter halophilus]QQK07037.1 aminotransferase class I/II-fold pyridoxal phosphate-dependent enzyme [Miniphocaeibacter halophilus]
MKNIKSPVLQGLLSMSKKDKFRFHMPGHKGKFLELYKSMSSNLLSLDFTEVNGTDDLYNSKEILKEGMDLLTKERMSKYSFYLTNGTTVGILASIMALTNNEDSILISKDCHKSVYSAIELNKLKPIILENIIYDSGLVLPIEEDLIINELKRNNNIKMVVFSRPNYYGLCSNIEKLAKYCSENEIFLLVDEAHGSHLNYHSDLPKNALKSGAHISVNSFHKTLPALTQSSVINFNHNLSQLNIKKVLNIIEKLQSSSPSYLLMTSIDISRAYMEVYGKEKLNSLKTHIEDFEKSIENLPWIKIPYIPNYIRKDFTRIILETKMPASIVQNYLEENNIYLEMISKNILVLITTTEDTKEDLEYLSRILKDFNPNYNINNNIVENIDDKNNNDNLHYVPLNKSAGKKLNENIIIYPPGSVYLKKGDIISEENIKYINELINSGIKVYTDFNKDINNLYISID